jgi:cell wall-associated NlpC family hydrolase
MKAFRITRVKLMLIAALACQMFNTYCTRMFQPESSAKSFQVQPHAGLKNNTDEQLENSSDKLVKTVMTRENIGKAVYLGGVSVADTLGTLADEIIEAAKKYLGVRHCMGGTTTKCIDCSGLVLNAFASQDIPLPHNAEAQSKFGTMIKSKDSLVKGDIVFFKGSYKTNHFITHAGIYAGNNSFIHASVGSGVTITSLDDPWWKKKFVFGKRIVRE